MKCPKCGYLGFETTERCRNCGYDFSLSVNVESASDLPLRGRTEAEAPLADFDLSGLDTSGAVREPASGLDLDRIIGATEPNEFPLVRRGSAEARRGSAEGQGSTEARHGSAETRRGSTEARQGSTEARQGSAETRRGNAETRKAHIETSAAVATPPPEDVQEQYHVPPPALSLAGGAVPSAVADATEPLPLFSSRQIETDDSRFPGAPRPAGPPLAVRRATPEVARRRTPRTIRRDDGELALQLESSATAPAAARLDPGVQAAPRLTRLLSALVDFALLAAIDGAILYLTLAIAGLSFDAVWIVPLIPMGAFLLLINGGYLIAFTAANGQTIGKMMTGIRVIGDDGGRVDLTGAVFRSAGIILSFFTLGLPYLPALLSDDGRALHDRLAGTRVVKGA